jgi:hypothetical protein
MHPLHVGRKVVEKYALLLNLKVISGELVHEGVNCNAATEF